MNSCRTFGHVTTTDNPNAELYLHPKEGKNRSPYTIRPLVHAKQKHQKQKTNKCPSNFKKILKNRFPINKTSTWPQVSTSLFEWLQALLKETFHRSGHLVLQDDHRRGKVGTANLASGSEVRKNTWNFGRISRSHKLFPHEI